MTGRISDERFTELSADYEAEQKELKERAAAIRAELSKAQEATVNAEKFMNVVRKYTSFEELTPTLLREFVEKIVVHECSYDENGTRRQDIDIYYSFVGQGRTSRRIMPDLSDTKLKCRMGTAKILHFYCFFIVHKLSPRA